MTMFTIRKIPTSNVRDIKDNQVRLKARPTRLPTPSHKILHHNWPRSGNVRITDSTLKVIIEMSVEPSKTSCSKR